jgi:hypothetical protein
MSWYLILRASQTGEPSGRVEPELWPSHCATAATGLDATGPERRQTALGRFDAHRMYSRRFSVVALRSQTVLPTPRSPTIRMLFAGNPRRTFTATRTISRRSSRPANSGAAFLRWARTDCHRVHGGVYIGN